MTATNNPWVEYDATAEYCAKRGLKGTYGDPLPPMISDDAAKLIAEDVEAFEERVRATAYALAMEKINATEE